MSLSQNYLCFKNPFFGFLLSCVQIDHCRIFPFDFSNLKLELISKITYFLDSCPYGVLLNLKIILRKCKKLLGLFQLVVYTTLAKISVKNI